jgi:microcystin-dependent protein
MDPFIGEIRAFGFIFVPYPWLACDGRLVSTQQYAALFSVIGNLYGGDGQKNTFGLPNLIGATPMCFGSGKGLTPYAIGQVVGEASVTLTEDQMAPHDHGVEARIGGLPASRDSKPAADDSISSLTYSNNSIGRAYCPPSNHYRATMDASMVAPTFGAPGPHENRQPYLPLLFAIATDGTYPVRP